MRYETENRLEAIPLIGIIGTIKKEVSGIFDCTTAVAFRTEYLELFTLLSR